MDLIEPGAKLDAVRQPLGCAVIRSPYSAATVGWNRVIGTALIVAALLLAACRDPAPGETLAAAPAAAPVDVVVRTLRAVQVPVHVELPGRTAAFATAEIRPQIGGIVLERLFTEGAEVRAGQVLYRIDAAAATAAVAGAEATLASARSALATARDRATRYRELVAIEAVSQESADAAQAAHEQAAAQVQAAEAALRSHRLALGYADVRSPIDGRIGRSSVSQGALVTAAQATALATVHQLDPIYVDAVQPISELLRVRRDLAQGRLRLENGRPTVRLVLDDGTTYPLAGELLLAEAIVDQTASSVTLRARFPNPRRELLPGMYVRVVFEGVVEREGLLVPQVAVTRDARGAGVAMVVGPDGRVEARTLVAERAVGDQWIVDQGLQPGERVVVEGLQRVHAGTVVRATEAPTANATASASATTAAAVPATASPTR